MHFGALPLVAAYIAWAAGIPPFVWTLIFIWSIAWEGWALWIAARNKHTWWFIAIFLIHLVGILEIVYIFGFGRKALQKPADASSSAV